MRDRRDADPRTRRDAGRRRRDAPDPGHPDADRPGRRRQLSQPGRRASEAIQIAGGLDGFLAAEIANDALLDLAGLAHGLDQVHIGVGADALLADEHAN